MSQKRKSILRKLEKTNFYSSNLIIKKQRIVFYKSIFFGFNKTACKKKISIHSVETLSSKFTVFRNRIKRTKIQFVTSQKKYNIATVNKGNMKSINENKLNYIFVKKIFQFTFDIKRCKTNNMKHYTTAKVIFCIYYTDFFFRLFPFS